MKKQSFIQGAIILIIANTISKILGAVFKIPLAYILKEEGMAIFNASFGAYIMLLSFITSGVPTAISKKTAEYCARKKGKEILGLVKTSEILMLAAGIAGTLILYFCADFLAVFVGDEQTAPCMRVLSPSVLFVAVGVVYKSYFQGVRNMTPTAVSQVTEAIIKLVLGYIFAIYFAPFGTVYAASGAVLGVTVGEVAATFILWLMYTADRRTYKISGVKNEPEMMADIVKFSLPLIITAGIAGIISMADVSLIRHCLEIIKFDAYSAERIFVKYNGFTNLFDDVHAALKIGEEGARWLYGAYSGYAMTVFHLPVGIIGVFGVSILPVIAGAVELGDKKRAARMISVALRCANLIAMPCFVIMLMLSSEILYMLFKNTASAGMLSAVAYCVIPASVITVTSAVLQASGKIMLPFRNMLAGAAVKFVLDYILITNPYINILGAPLSAAADLSICAALNMISVGKHIGMKYDNMKIFFKPLLSAVVMGIFIFFIKPVVNASFGGIIMPLFIIIASGAAVYAGMIFVTGSITLKETEILRKRRSGEENIPLIK
ncbi:MAG: polysaccharide biosynthesis protein [Oscillospiraceae bacterium]|nr:polysaccharide biosynthesis protein [Oscillospiraceae bacterium]